MFHTRNGLGNKFLVIRYESQLKNPIVQQTRSSRHWPPLQQQQRKLKRAKSVQTTAPNQSNTKNPHTLANYKVNTLTRTTTSRKKTTLSCEYTTPQVAPSTNQKRNSHHETQKPSQHTTPTNMQNTLTRTSNGPIAQKNYVHESEASSKNSGMSLTQRASNTQYVDTQPKSTQETQNQSLANRHAMDHTKAG